MYHSRMYLHIAKTWRGPLLGLVYLLVWLSLEPSRATYWNLLAGWRFGMLLLTPARYWPWLIGAEWAGGAIFDVWLGSANAVEYILGDMPAMLVTAPCVAIARRVGARPALPSPDYVVRLLGSALFVALAITAADAALIAFIHGGLRLDGMIAILGGELLGDYLGILLIAPVLILLVHAR